MNVVTTIPKTIRENLARAKAYLVRDDCERSLEAGLAAVREYMSIKIVGEAKFKLEVLIMEYVTELNRHHLIRDFFHANRITKEPFVQYARGQEKKLTERMETILHGLRYQAEQKNKEEEDKALARKEQQYNTGLELLSQGELPRGKAYLRRYAEEYGEEPGVTSDVANIFMKHQLYPEAAELFSKAIEDFPNDPKGYAGAVMAYTQTGPMEKVEEMYLLILRKFGPHPKTLLNFSKFYLSWRKREKAWDYARQALSKDSSLVEAKEIVEKYG